MNWPPQGRLRPSATTIASLIAYSVLLTTALAEKWGQTTDDTTLSLVTAPAQLLRSTFSLWNPQLSFGELQNQAYGYLFPMGPFFAGLESLHVPVWATERLWSVVVIVVACEGARRVCRSLDLGAWPAWIAGMAYGLNPRMLSEIGVRSAEVLPTAVLPWVLLPVLMVLRGRIDHRRGALLSATAFLFVGGVNGTASIAPLPFVVVFIIWGIRRGRARWSLLAWWGGLIGVASVWWASSLVQLGAYSPPFFNYVEDAATTTKTAGFDAAIRGASNWVGYLTTGDRPSWPAAWSLSYSPLLVVATGLVAAISLVGLACFRSPWRTPLALSALIGLTCLTVGHTSVSFLQSPLAPSVQHLLDDPFALLRNIAKIDPVLRLPMAVGLAAALEHVIHRVRSDLSPGARSRRWARTILTFVCVLVTLVAQPALAMNLRTPGWSSIPSYWTQASSFLHAMPGQNRAWVIPGSGFGVETWGWTMDEPMSAVAQSPWVTRSQAPLVPPETIRLLDSLEQPLESGVGSPDLGATLARVGISYVVVRHDLDPSLPEASDAILESKAMAGSGGVERVATFGEVGGTPAIEIYRVTDKVANGFSLTNDSAVRTVSSGPADVLAAVTAGVLPSGQAAIVQNDSGWNSSADIVGDGYQLRERQFGLVQDAEGAVLSFTEPRHADRLTQNYPGSPSASPVTARYVGIDYVDASSSQGYTNTLGPVLPDEVPFAAVDGDPKTAWTTGYLTDPVGQWLEVHYTTPQTLTTVQIQSPPGGEGVLRWRVSAGGTSVLASVNPFTGQAVAHFAAVRSKTLRITAVSVRGGQQGGQISVVEISAPDLPAQRTLVVPATADAPQVDYLFHTQPEVRACVPTSGGPNCEAQFYQPAEESTGIDRTFTVDHAGSWTLSGAVAARSEPATALLLDPRGAGVVMHASSTYVDDPGVSARMAYDGSSTTSWIADPADPTPTLTVDFSHPRLIDQISVGVPAAPAVAPTSAVITAGRQTRTVQIGGNGYAAFAPLRAKHLTVSFQNPMRDGAPLGVSELRLGPGTSDVPFDGSVGTGAYCGFGPNVYVDGVRHLTRVTGTTSDVSNDEPLGLALCGKPLKLSVGAHRIRIASTPQFQPIQLLLAQGDKDTPIPPSRSLRVDSATDHQQRLTVGAGTASILSTVSNYNAGWRATLDGKPLPAQRVDGWAQGWRIPAGAGGTILIVYAPQRTYLIGLVVGLVLGGALLAAALVVLLGRRRRPPARPGLAPARPRRQLLSDHLWIRLAAAIVIAGVLGGAPCAIGAGLGCGLRRPRLPVILGGLLLVAGSFWTATTLMIGGPHLAPETANALSGCGAALLLTLMLTKRPGDEA